MTQCPYCKHKPFATDIGMEQHIRRSHYDILNDKKRKAEEESRKLRALASKIEKVPDFIHVPTEYLV